MLALALAFTVCGAASAGVVHEIEQVGLTWVPAAVTVAPGDTVRWTRNSASHTVTSGSNCTFDRLFFDEPLNAGTPIFEWTVPDDAPASVPFFCRPHCGFGMVGTITVEQAPECLADLNGDGDTDFFDLLVLLSLWGPCGDCDADLDDNGGVDFGDLLLLLTTWGPCP